MIIMQSRRIYFIIRFSHFITWYKIFNDKREVSVFSGQRQSVTRRKLICFLRESRANEL